MDRYLILGIPLAVILLGLLAGCSVATYRLFKATGGQSSLAAAVDGLSWPAASFLLTIVFVAATHPLIRGVATGIWDADGAYFPYFTLVSDHAKAGQFLTWDLWTNGGAPVMGDPQFGALSPIVLAFGLLPIQPSQAFIGYWLVSWWLGGIGMLLLGRHLGAPAWGGLLVALGFLFCGVYTGNAQHTSWIVAFSFVPWIIWRLDAALTQGYRAAAEAGALWGLQGLAGYPAIVLLTACYVALWLIGRAIFASFCRGTPARRHLLIRCPIVLLIMVTVGVLVFLPTYVSFFFDGQGVNNRTTEVDRAAALGATDPGSLATFASPYLTIVDMKLKNRLWAADVSMINVYAGLIIPLAALSGLLLRRRSGWRWWIVGLGVLSFCCYLGETLPLRGWLYDLLPPMRYFRGSSVFRLFGVLSLTLLALVGINDLDRILAAEHRESRRSIVIIAGALSVLAAVALLPIILTRSPDARILISVVHSAFFWGALLSVACFVYLSQAPARRSIAIVLLMGLAVTDALVTTMLETPTIMALGETRWRHLDAKHVRALDQTKRGAFRDYSPCPNVRTSEMITDANRCKLDDQMVTKVPSLEAYSTDESPWRAATSADPVLRASATGADRFWFTERETTAKSCDATFAAFLNRAHSLGRVPIVVNEGGNCDSRNTTLIANAPPALQIPARILRYAPRELMFDVTSPAAGWLLVTDRWSPRWKVTVNEAEQPVRLANFIFRAARLQPGKNRVQFTYRPWGFPWLIGLSWLVLSTQLALALVTVTRHLLRANKANGSVPNGSFRANVCFGSKTDGG